MPVRPWKQFLSEGRQTLYTIYAAMLAHLLVWVHAGESGIVTGLAALGSDLLHLLLRTVGEISRVVASHYGVVFVVRIGAAMRIGLFFP